MTTAPKVSVIIPAYCAADHLHVAIDSLRAQTLTDFEAIIVEDRSPDQDATLHAAEDIAASDSRFRVARTPVNSGGGPARNVGIELARGEYIATLDADDSLAPDALENLYCIAKLHNADQVCYAMEHHYATGYVTGHSEGATETVYTDPHEIKELALSAIWPSYEPGRRQYPQFTGCSPPPADPCSSNTTSASPPSTTSSARTLHSSTRVCATSAPSYPSTTPTTAIP